MKLQYVLLVFCQLTFCLVQGQGFTSSPIKRVAISSVSLQSGVMYKQRAFATLTDYKTLAPESQLLQQDFSTYASNNLQNIDSNPYFSMYLGLKFGDKAKTTYKKNPVLRLGLTYLENKTLYSYRRKEETFLYDTLVSVSTGQQYLIDSMTYRRLSAHYGYEQLLLDGALLYSTNSSARWSLSMGIGIMAGISLLSNANISYSQTAYITAPSGVYFYSYRSNTTKGETVKSKSNIGLASYIPIGIDMRLANKNTFWNKIHLFYEIRPTIGVLKIQQLPAIVQSNLQQGFGIKVAI